MYSSFFFSLNFADVQQLILHMIIYIGCLYRYSDLGEHGYLIEGKLQTKKTAASVSIPYKYLVYKRKKEEYEYEYIYKMDSQKTTNRCLFVKPHLLNEEGKS